MVGLTLTIKLSTANYPPKHNTDWSDFPEVHNSVL